MASYASKVKADIERWRAAELVDAMTAEALRRDVEENARRGFSFGSILAMLAALLFGAAILIFVAANWDAFPRIMRVCVLFGVILAGYVGGALLKLRDQSGAGEACYIVAGAAFGASIALIGQMYHLSGDESQAILVWCAGVALGAALLRSAPSTVAAVALAGAWLWIRMWDFWNDEPLPHLYLALLAGLWALSLWTQARAARHLILLSLVMYVVLAYFHNDLLLLPVGLALVSAGLFLAAVREEALVERILRLGGGATVHGLIGFGAGMMLLQFAMVEEAAFIPVILVIFAGSIAALMLGGRDSRLLRWLAYALFGVELCFVYVATVGTMLGTAGFLLASGLILAIMAYVIMRLERRLKRPISEGSAA